MKKFPFDFKESFGSEDLVTLKFTYRLDSDVERIQVRFVTSTAEGLTQVAKQLVDDEHVLNCAVEYVQSFKKSALYLVIPLKSEDQPIEEVE